MMFSLLVLLPPPISTLFPYTTLFRSDVLEDNHLFVGFLKPGCERRKGVLEQPREQLGIHLGDALRRAQQTFTARILDRKSTRLNSSHVAISYAVFCLKKKKKISNSTS